MTPTRRGRRHLFASVLCIVLLSLAFSFIPNNGPLRAVEAMLLLVAGLGLLRDLVRTLGATVRGGPR